MPWTKLFSNGMAMPEPPPANTEFQTVTGPAVSRADAEAVVADSLDTGGLNLNQKIDSQLGGGPDPEHAKGIVPDCSGMTYDACEATLEAAGFLGILTKTTIPAEDAQDELGENSVVDTRPQGGAPHNKYGRIEVLVNPPALVGYTLDELADADEMVARNPTLRDSPTSELPVLKARQIMRKCQALLLRAAISLKSKCKGRPILIIGRDAYEAARHDARAIATYPKWVELHRRGRVGFNSSWNRNTYPCTLGKTREDIVQECDEYPFGASFEGFFGSATTPFPSVEMISRAHNKREGRVLQHFYSNNLMGKPGRNPKSKPILFPGCGWNLAANPTPTEPNVQSPTPVEDSDYLLIPMPFAKFDSIGLCNVFR